MLKLPEVSSSKSKMLSRTASTVARRALSAQARRNASTLVVAAHADGKLAGDTLACVSAASQVGGPVTVMVAGASEETAKEAAAIDGVTAVLHTADEAFAHGVAENMTSLVVAAQKEGGFTHIFGGSNNYCKAFMPRVGAALDVQPISGRCFLSAQIRRYGCRGAVSRRQCVAAHICFQGGDLDLCKPSSPSSFLSKTSSP